MSYLQVSCDACGTEHFIHALMVSETSNKILCRQCIAIEETEQAQITDYIDKLVKHEETTQ
jgi:hypothetical protein